MSSGQKNSSKYVITLFSSSSKFKHVQANDVLVEKLATVGCLVQPTHVSLRAFNTHTHKELLHPFGLDFRINKYDKCFLK